MCSIAIVYDKQRKYPEALQLLQGILAIYKRIFGDEHSSTVRTRHMLERVRMAIQDEGRLDSIQLLF